MPSGTAGLEMSALRELGGDLAASRGVPIDTYTSSIENGLRIALALGDRAREADMLARLAIIAANRLRFDAAIECGRRAVTAGRASGDEQALAVGLDGLKIVCLNIGDAPGPGHRAGRAHAAAAPAG